MRYVLPLAAVVPLLVVGGVVQAQVQGEVRTDGKYITIERPGEPPIVLLGTDKMLARQDLIGTWQVQYL